jgi:hypothetical protein
LVKRRRYDKSKHHAKLEYLVKVFIKIDLCEMSRLAPFVQIRATQAKSSGWQVTIADSEVTANRKIFSVV